MINCRVTCVKEYSPNCFPRPIEGTISPVLKELHMNHLNYHFNPENITLPFWYYQCCTCGTYSIMREFAYDPLLILMEGNLHCTGKVAGFCHHIGIVKEHQWFRPSIAGKVISRIWQETINPNIQLSIKAKFHTLCQSFHNFNEVQTLPLQCPPQFHLGPPQDQPAK